MTYRRKLGRNCLGMLLILVKYWGATILTIMQKGHVLKLWSLGYFQTAKPKPQSIFMLWQKLMTFTIPINPQFQFFHWVNRLPDEVFGYLGPHSQWQNSKSEMICHNHLDVVTPKERERVERFTTIFVGFYFPIWVTIRLASWVNFTTIRTKCWWSLRIQPDYVVFRTQISVRYTLNKMHLFICCFSSLNGSEWSGDGTHDLDLRFWGQARWNTGFWASTAQGWW